MFSLWIATASGDVLEAHELMLHREENMKGRAIVTTVLEDLEGKRWDRLQLKGGQKNLVICEDETIGFLFETKQRAVSHLDVVATAASGAKQFKNVDPIDRMGRMQSAFIKFSR